MTALALNFGLVHEPAKFDYSQDPLPPEIAEQLPEETAEILQLFTEEELLFLRWRICWKQMARNKQLPPLDFQDPHHPCYLWGLRSGRGFGKTLAAANWMGITAWEEPGFYGVVSPTHDDVRYTCFEGPTGLLSCIPPRLIKAHNSSLPMVILTNGSVIRGYAGDTPERLRGPNFHGVWGDEIASWKYPEEAWSNIMFALRAGDNPRMLWTGTPKPTPFIRELQGEKNSIVVVGSTYENEDLTASFYDNVAKYEGTKIGRQELYGDVLDPEEEGFVRRSQWRMWPHDEPLPKLDFIVYSLDTAFTEKTFNKKHLENDPTACSVWGLFKRKRGNKYETNVILLDAWEDYLGLPALVRKIKKERRNRYGPGDDEPLLRPKIVPKNRRPGPRGKKIDIILIEDKGSGISLRQTLATENILAEGYNPGHADKLTRLHAVSMLWPHGRVWAVESDVRPGTFKKWAEPLISQVCSYTGPGSVKHDDLLDTTTQALKLMMDKFFDPLTVPRDPEDEKRQAALAETRRRKRRKNPYGN